MAKKKHKALPGQRRAIEALIRIIKYGKHKSDYKVKRDNALVPYLYQATKRYGLNEGFSKSTIGRWIREEIAVPPDKIAVIAYVVIREHLYLKNLPGNKDLIKKQIMLEVMNLIYPFDELLKNPKLKFTYEHRKRLQEFIVKYSELILLNHISPIKESSSYDSQNYLFQTISEMGIHEHLVEVALNLSMFEFEKEPIVDLSDYIDKSAFKK